MSLKFLSHSLSLSNKNYQSLHGINPPDYVFMFIPIEPALYVALQYDMNLYNKAFEYCWKQSFNNILNSN